MEKFICYRTNVSHGLDYVFNENIAKTNGRFPAIWLKEASPFINRNGSEE